MAHQSNVDIDRIRALAASKENLVYKYRDADAEMREASRVQSALKSIRNVRDVDRRKPPSLD